MNLDTLVDKDGSKNKKKDIGVIPYAIKYFEGKLDLPESDVGRNYGPTHPFYIRK